MFARYFLGHKNLIAPEPVLMWLLDEVGEGKAHQTPHNITQQREEVINKGGSDLRSGLKLKHVRQQCT